MSSIIPFKVGARVLCFSVIFSIKVLCPFVYFCYLIYYGAKRTCPTHLSGISGNNYYETGHLQYPFNHMYGRPDLFICRYGPFGM